MLRSDIDSVRTTARGFMRAFALALLVLPAPSASAQAQKPAQESDEPLSLEAHLVNVDVMVKDKKGRFITDLRPEEFVVTENGVPQTVEFFDPPASVATPEAAPGAPAGSTLARGTAPGEPRNIISLLLDAKTTGHAETKRVAEGTAKYIRERIASTDVVAVFAVADGLKLLQPFTSDKTKLIAAVASGFAPSPGTLTGESREVARSIVADQERLKALQGSDAALAAARSNSAAAGSLAIMAATRSLARFQVMRSQLSVSQSRPVLAALAAICEAQQGIPGKKSVVLFSQGFITGSTQDWQVQGLVDIANRSNVAIYIIDSEGLRASAPRDGGYAPRGPLDGISGATSQESRIRAVGGETVFDHVRHEGDNREQEILYRISGDTGGAFFKNNNDIARSLERIDTELRARYTLGYYSTDAKFDGEFRRLKIEVRRPGVEVVARPGYYAVAAGEVVPLSPADRKLLAGFDAAAAKPELPLFAELTPFRGSDGRFVVPLSLEVPPASLEVTKKGATRELHFDVLGVVRDERDGVLARLGGAFDVRLDEEQYAAVVKNNVYFRQDVELDPGEYTVELIVRDRSSGKTAAKRQPLRLPEAGAGFAMSGVVLSRLAIPARPAAGAPLDVLAAQGAQIRPSPSRVFRAEDNLIVFFDLYNPGKGTAGPRVDGTITVLNDAGAARKKIEFALTEVETEPVPHLTVAKFVRLAGLPPGSYSARIEAKDATGAVVSHSVPFAIAQ